MARTAKPPLFVVDGSNIATEGRSTPSLEQLNEAVLAFLDAHPDVTVTVVVDATFGHRIAKHEVAAFDEAVANNELVTPPAGAVGRGDAFILAVADRANAGILSNDSFQEFHGEYDWLFDDGRLVGGKPVPHVGWVFVNRNPVRGPKSRQAVREASDDPKATKERANLRVRKRVEASPEESSAPESVASATVESEAGAPVGDGRRGRRGRGRSRSGATAVTADVTTGLTVGAEQQATIEAARAATPREHVNDLMPFLDFVEHHPLGTSCTAVVESYSSHGAYARVGEVLVYIPLRLMDAPPPRSARSVLALGEAVTAVIVGYVPDRRSIDAALPHMAGTVVTVAEPTEEAPSERPVQATGEPEGATPATSRAGRRPARKSPAKRAAEPALPVEVVVPTGAVEPKPSRRSRAAKADTAVVPEAAIAPTETPTPARARKAAAKRTAAKKAPAEKATPQQSPTDQAPPAKAPATRASAKKAAADQTSARKAAATKAPATKAPATKMPVNKAPAKKAPAGKAPAKQAAATKAPAKQAPAGKAPAKQAAATKAPAKQAPAKQAPAKQAPAKQAPAKQAATKKAAASKPARATKKATPSVGA